MDRRFEFAVLLVAGAVLLAGCGAGAPGDKTQFSPSPTPTTTQASPSAPTSTTTPQTSSGGTSTPGPATVNGTLSVHFINVGQSVSTLIVGPTGETMLIDSGDWRDDGELVLSYLQQHSITRIDYLVTSHGDADHIGGHAAVIEYFETEADGIGAIYDPGIASSSQTYQRYLDAVETHDVQLFKTREGDHIPFAGVEVRVLGPPEENLASGERNENSLVLELGFGKTSFLFTGDAEEAGEQYLVSQHETALRATVLKAGHHGSKSSTSEVLLDAVQPRVVVISSAYDSQFGHPNNETLERLANRDIPTYWTAVHGNIVLVSNGTAITINAQQAAPTAPLDLRTARSIPPEDTSPLQRLDVIRVTQDTSPDSTPILTDGGVTPTSTPTGQLALADVHADAAGSDRDNLNDEYIVFSNTGDGSIDLSGWTVSDEAGHTYTFPAETTLDPGETLTLHTGSGTDSETDVYWESDSPVWNNGGDTVIVKNVEGETILEETYS